MFNRKDRRFIGQQQKKQAAQQQPQPQMQLMSNGGVNDAVNFAVEDFYKAQMVLGRCTNNYTKPYNELPPGVQSFVSQQFFRMNAAGQMLDALGYQGVTEIMAMYAKAAIEYIRVTMVGWNQVITEEGEVKKIWDALEAEDQATVQHAGTVQ